MRDSSASQQTKRRAYVHEAAESGVRLVLDFGVVDRIAADVLRGLSALPRRGMEVGGLLLGTVDTDEQPVRVSIEDYVAVPCEHLYGPNFELSPKDREAFAELAASWAPGPGRPLHAIGLYRSHTRGELELTAADVELLDRWVPQPWAVCLVIRPYATRPAEAAFYFRRGGAFQPGPPASTIPFRRRELGGGSPPRRGAANATAAPAAQPAGEAAAPAEVETWTHPPAPAAPPAKSGGSWLLVPAMLAFLLVGVVIGVQVEGLLRPPPRPAETADPFALGLTAVQFGSAIHLRWNPQAPALAACQSAALVIRDGPNTKMIHLRKEDLARGALIYQYMNPAVSFRMEAILSPANTVSESLELRLMPPEGGSGAEAPDPVK
ncbi:MAG: hypothetical protein ACP5UT_08660 [Bryobacteraceae bacterium]